MTDTSKHQYGSELWTVILLVSAVAIAGILYRIVVLHRLEQTSLLFIGIPAVLAVLVALTPKAETTSGAILRGITIALLLSGVLLGEGFICIVMASPLFYVVGLFVAGIIEWSRKKHNAPLSCVLLILAPMSLEGVTPWLSFDRDETVQTSQIVNSSTLEVERALDRSPRTDLPLPPYLRMGFPRPVLASGTGLEPGATRTIHFAGGEGKPGDLILRVEKSQPGFVHFAVVADHSKIAHWLDWNSSDVTWTALDPQHTRVTWTIHFQRRLDPAWYFSPWERYAVRLAANYLIRANAIPSASTAGRGWSPLISQSRWLTNLELQIIALLALAGVSAVQEFALRGGGTPLPFDSPHRLVTSGIYRYIANPMQLSCAAVVTAWGALIRNPWVALAGVMSFIYSAGLANWDEGADLKIRFGEPWLRYRRHVRPWRLRRQPWHDPALPFPRLYVSETCGPCSEVRRWFIARHALALEIVPAEDHPTRDLDRMTYDPMDGSPPEDGVRAFARGLEHINLGWALAGAMLRLPGMCEFVQLLMDASSLGPRTIPRRNKACSLREPISLTPGQGLRHSNSSAIDEA